MRIIDLTIEDFRKEMSLCFNECIKNSIPQKSASDENNEHFLTITEAAKYISLTIATVYGLTSRKEIPHIKKGKRLYFLKKDLNQYLENGRNKTKDEVLENATKSINAFLSKTK